MGYLWTKDQQNQASTGADSFLLLPMILLAVALTLAGCVSVAGGLAANPGNLNFGNVVVGSSGKQTVTVTNSSASALTVTQAVASGKGFAVTGPALPLTLGAGQSATFTTTFAPTAAGGAVGSVSITGNAQTPGAQRPTGGSGPSAVTTRTATVAVNGAGVPPTGPLQITSGALPNAQAGIQFVAPIAATGGAQPYHWSIASGALPSGLSLDPSTGVISGTTTQGGQFSFSVQVSDSSSPAPQTAMKALTLYVLAFATSSCGVVGSTPSSPPSGLSLVCSGTGIDQTVTIESVGQFRLVFEAADNWGLSQWYDLVNDPTAATNLAGPLYSVNGSSTPCFAEPGLQNMVFYGDTDKKLDMRVAGCSYPTAGRSMTIIQNNPSLVILETSGHPMDGIPRINNNVTATVRYYIYPNGQIYVHKSISVVNAQDFGAGGTADLFIADMGLEDPVGTGSAPPDSQGWIRATSEQNPFKYEGHGDKYVFAYWGSGTTSPYSSWTKASIMLVWNPANGAPSTYSQIVHGWAAGSGYGVVRWGYRIPGPNMSAGQTLSFDFLMQLGTQNSSLLSNLTSSTVCDSIANAYLANPTPPPAPTPPPGPTPPPTPTSIVITPSVPPAVNQGATFKFTANVPVTWSMAPGSQGTIDADGTYHAPASLTAKQSYGGYQVLPNNHIFNTRIDSLPVNPQAAAWIAGAGTVPVNYLPSFPVNYVDGSTPTQNMSFYYTSANNGPFQIPQYPDAKIESGWFSGPFGPDRHFFAIDTTNGTFQEMYNYYNAGANTSCPLCTSQSGVRYSGSTYDLPSAGATDAAGMYVMPLTLHLQELEQALATGGTINHALRFTLSLGYCASADIWPATTFATDGGTVPFGARFRLKASFDTSKFSPIAKILLTQLKQYGIILADGGAGWQITTDYARWPTSIQSAFAEIAGANIGPSNFEAVDESGLMVSASSGNTNVGGETVVATSVSNSANKAQMPVVLTGVTVNLPDDVLYIQAGTPAQQFRAFVNGASNTGVTWTMNPSVGTFTSGGFFTPPATLASVQVTTVTATSVANPNVFAQMTVTVFPSGTIRIVNGRSSPYTDSQGNVWAPMTGDDGGFSYDNSGTGTWPTTADIYLYKAAYNTFDDTGDMRFDFTVPNGTYSIMGKFAVTAGPGFTIEDLEAQGHVLFSNIDIFVSAGGNNKPVDFVLPATVTNGKLSFVLRHVGAGTPNIEALQIAPIP